MYLVDITIIGAGVVGLALAHQLSPLGATVIIEREAAPGQGTSSRNSEVIHAGIYYPTGFLKTRLCVQGSRLLYEFCERQAIPHCRTGKLIVAQAASAELESIEQLCRRAEANGVEDLRLLERAELKKKEPHVGGSCALFSPSTGIIDSHRLMRRLEALALAQGAIFLPRTTLTGLDQKPGHYQVAVQGPAGDYRFASRIIINAAGLNAQAVARMAGIDPDAAGYRLHYAKGEYFRVRASKAALIGGLVYPSPARDLTGLGIHVTKDLAGGVKLGPNAFYVDNLDYRVDPAHRKDFFEDTHSLLPFLEPGDLEPDMAGIRPKLQAPGAPARDFVIEHEHARGLAGLINLIGIESPGLSACLAIARHVEAMLQAEGMLKPG